MLKIPIGSKTIKLTSSVELIDEEYKVEDILSWLKDIANYFKSLSYAVKKNLFKVEVLSPTKIKIYLKNYELEVEDKYEVHRYIFIFRISTEDIQAEVYIYLNEKYLYWDITVDSQAMEEWRIYKGSAENYFSAKKYLSELRIAHKRIFFSKDGKMGYF